MFRLQNSGEEEEGLRERGVERRGLGTAEGWQGREQRFLTESGEESLAGFWWDRGPGWRHQNADSTKEHVSFLETCNYVHSL